MRTLIRSILELGIRRSLQEIYFSWITHLEGSIGRKLRYAYYKKRMKHLGNSVIIDTGVIISNPAFVSVDEHTHLDRYCHLIGSPPNLDLSYRALKERHLNQSIEKGSITIGKECHIGQYALIVGYYGVSIGDNCTMSEGSKAYSLTSLPYHPFQAGRRVSIQPYIGESPTLAGSVILGRNVWLGLNSIVQPGVFMAEDSFLKTNSVITTSCASNAYMEGIPAKQTKNRY